MNSKLKFTKTTTLILLALLAQNILAQVKPGIDVLLEEQVDLIRGKRIGLITNPTGVRANLTSSIDALHDHPAVKLTALFGPEHGVRGDVFAGEKIADTVDAKTGIPVFSLYGENRTPTAAMLKNVDVLIYDIQDVGSRAYTYIYTMALAMAAAAKAGLPFIVLDRPNPLGGELVEGPILEERFKSFVGLYPIPYIYGLTVGELAQYFNQEFKIGADLTVVKMTGWRRDMLFADTGLPWVPTSPHVPHAMTPFFIAATGCLGELHAVNEGVGYTMPFELIGQTWIDGEELAAELNTNDLPGVEFRPLHYRPYYFVHQGKVLSGVQIHLTEPRQFRPMLVQLHILAALVRLYPQQDLFNPERITSFYRAIGTDSVQRRIIAGQSAQDIYDSYQAALADYLRIRQKYLLY